jgi:hypothetical protein
MKPALILMILGGLIGCASKPAPEALNAKKSPRPAITMDHNEADNKVTYQRYRSNSGHYPRSASQ